MLWQGAEGSCHCCWSLKNCNAAQKRGKKGHNIQMLIWLMDGGAATADTGNCCATCWWEAAGQYLYDLLTCSEESIHLLLNPMRKLKSYPKWFSNMTYFFKKSNDIYWDTDNNTNVTLNTTEYFIRAEVNCAAQITSTFVDCVAESTVGSSISRNSMIRESEAHEPRKAWPALLSPVLLRFANGKRFFYPSFQHYFISHWQLSQMHCTCSVLWLCSLSGNGNLAVKQHI